MFTYHCVTPHIHTHITLVRRTYIMCNVNMSTHIEVVHANLLCGCCCIVVVCTLSTYTTHTRIHHDEQTCITVVHTRIVVVPVAVGMLLLQQQAGQKITKS